MIIKLGSQFYGQLPQKKFQSKYSGLSLLINIRNLRYNIRNLLTEVLISSFIFYFTL